MTSDSRMPVACSGCGGWAGIRWGRSQRAVLDLNEAGNTARSTLSLQRWRCSGCGVVRAETPPGIRQRSLASIAVRDAVAYACMDAGYAAAGARYGMDEKTARTLWDEWSALKEVDQPSLAPENIGLHCINTGGADKTLITDTSLLTVVAFLDGADEDSIREWLSTHEGWRVQHAVISPIPAYRDALRGEAVECIIAILPAHSRLASLRAWIGGFRAMSRGMHNQGRNVRESVRVFATSTPTASEMEDMQGWDASILALYGYKNQFMSALEEGRDLSVIAAIASSAATIGGSYLPLRLVSSWGNEMHAGVSLHASMAAVTGDGDDAGIAIDALCKAVTTRRPALCFPLLRGLILFRSESSSTVEDTMDRRAEGLEERATVIHGVLLQDALHALSNSRASGSECSSSCSASC